MHFEFTFANYGGDCVNERDECIKEIEFITDKIQGDISTPSCEQENSYCRVSYKCTNCELIGQGSFTLNMLEDKSYASDIYIKVRSSSSIPNEVSELKTAILGENDKYFRGSDPSVAYLLLTPSLFINDSGDWESELKGYHITLSKDSEKGSQIDYSE